MKPSKVFRDISIREITDKPSKAISAFS
jgi:hypothetical protein